MFHSIFSKIVLGNYPNNIYSKHHTYTNLNNFFAKNNKPVLLYGLGYYTPIYEFINNTLIPLFTKFFKNYKRIEHIVNFGVNNIRGRHEFSPQTPALDITYKVVTKTNLQIAKIKFFPYNSAETNKQELNLYMRMLDPEYAMIFRAVFKQLRLLQKYSCINFSSTRTLQAYAILNKLMPMGLDSTRKNFKKDLDTLNDYATKINKKVPLDLAFDENGIIANRNKNIKLLPIEDMIPFPITSSYIFTP